MISRRLVIAVVVLLAISAALGGYVFYLKRTAERPLALSTDTRPVTPPVAGPSVPITLFLANDSDGLLYKRTVIVALPEDPAKRAQEILRVLVSQYLQPDSPHPLGPGADINDVYLLQNQTAVIDVNTPFAQGQRSGILEEELTLASMAETLAANVPGISQIKLLIDGQERATLAGHADLKQPFQVSEAARLVKP